MTGTQPASGQADSARRPRRRRDARIARPARVRMRRRKPCVLARLRLFGWKVCLLTSHSIDRRQTQLTCGSTEAGCRPDPSHVRFVRPPTPASRENREVRTHRGTGPQHRTLHRRGASSQRSNRRRPPRSRRSTGLRNPARRRTDLVTHMSPTALCTRCVNNGVHKTHTCDFHTVVHRCGSFRDRRGRYAQTVENCVDVIQRSVHTCGRIGLGDDTPSDTSEG